MERRNVAAGGLKIEERAGGGGKIISGYAAVFHDKADPGTEYQLRTGLSERISPAAFTRAITEQQDTVALYNHDVNLVLGRVSAGTLRLSADTRGLKYEISIPDTQLGRDLAVSIGRGDVAGSSFAFNPKSAPIAMIGGTHVRTIEDCDLLDVGPVIFPAYRATSTSVRCLDSETAIAEIDRQLAEAEAEAVAVRLRIISLG